MRRTKTATKGYYKTKCDEIFSLIVRMRDHWECQAGGPARLLQCAHIVSRSYKNIRWDLRNAICLSSSKHRYYTDRPLEWEDFVTKLKKASYYRQLKKWALIDRKWTLADLKLLYDQLQTVRASWDERERCFRLYTNPGRAITHRQSAF